MLTFVRPIRYIYYDAELTTRIRAINMSESKQGLVVADAFDHKL